MNDTCDIELRITSSPKHLCVARATVTTAIKRLGFDEDACGKVELAVDEALTNVIRHGYYGREDGLIWIRLTCTGDEDNPGFEIVIDDEGKQVDPAKICGRDLEDVRPGGLGVHIINEVMDSAQYSMRPNGGMRLTMSKRAVNTTTNLKESECYE